MNDNHILLPLTTLSRLLLNKGWMFACAESCTGGLLAAALTSQPGSSTYFEGGLVTYSNASKVKLLDVNPDTLERFGAVSEETALEMAAGVLAAFPDANLAISTTGIAGPDGATTGKPVGMVCFGFSQRTGQGIVTRAATKVFEGDRQQVRQASVAFGLQSAAEWMV